MRPAARVDVQRASALERQATANPKRHWYEWISATSTSTRAVRHRPSGMSGAQIEPKNVNASTDLGVSYSRAIRRTAPLTQLTIHSAIDPVNAKTLTTRASCALSANRNLDGAAKSWERSSSKWRRSHRSRARAYRVGQLRANQRRHTPPPQAAVAADSSFNPWRLAGFSAFIAHSDRGQVADEIHRRDHAWSGGTDPAAGRGRCSDARRRFVSSVIHIVAPTSGDTRHATRDRDNTVYFCSETAASVVGCQVGVSGFHPHDGSGATPARHR